MKTFIIKNVLECMENIWEKFFKLSYFKNMQQFDVM